jgi:hypothetical protein
LRRVDAALPLHHGPLLQALVRINLHLSYEARGLGFSEPCRSNGVVRGQSRIE